MKFFGHTITSLHSFVRQSGGINRYIITFAKRTYCPDVVGVIVSNKYSHYIVKIQSDISEIFSYCPHSYPGINQNTIRSIAQKITISTASAPHALKSQFVHIFDSNNKFTKLTLKTD